MDEDLNMESENIVASEVELESSIHEDVYTIADDITKHETLSVESAAVVESSEVTSLDESISTQNDGSKKDFSKAVVSKKKKESTRQRPLNLPLSRVKQIMKMDPDLNLAGSEAVFLVAKATELFIEALSKDAYNITLSAKKKTIQKKDVEAAIKNTDALCFLDGIDL